MMKRGLKCSICCLLVMGLLLCQISFPAQAKPAVAGDRLTSETAGYFAKFFLRDSLASSSKVYNIAWTEQTEIRHMTCLYDTEGKPSAYCFELSTEGKDSGYIMVSAYENVYMPILEYADSGQPPYAQFPEYYDTETRALIYTGPFGYYQETEDGKLSALDGEAVSRDEVIDTVTPGESVLSAAASNGDGTIKDPFDYAEEQHGGTWTAYEWSNPYEFDLYPKDTVITADTTEANSCGPVALTNLLTLWGNHKKVKSITGVTPAQRLKQVIQYGKEKGYFQPSNHGTPLLTIKEYETGMFTKYGVSLEKIYEYKPISYDQYKRQIEGEGPFLLYFSNHETYGEHYVLGYAYTRLKSESTGYYRSFVKIRDGWSREGRFVTMDSTFPKGEFYSYVISAY